MNFCQVHAALGELVVMTCVGSVTFAALPEGVTEGLPYDTLWATFSSQAEGIETFRKSVLARIHQDMRKYVSLQVVYGAEPRHDALVASAKERFLLRVAHDASG